MHANWKPRQEEMYHAYLKWKYGDKNYGTVPEQCTHEQVIPQAAPTANNTSRLSTNPVSGPINSIAQEQAENIVPSQLSVCTADVGSVEPIPIPTDAPGSDDNRYDFPIDVLNIYTLDTCIIIPQTALSNLFAEALMLQGYISNTPERLSIAISICTLELFHHICAHKPSFSVEAFAKVLCDIYNVSYFNQFMYYY